MDLNYSPYSTNPYKHLALAPLSMQRLTVLAESGVKCPVELCIGCIPEYRYADVAWHQFSSGKHIAHGLDVEVVPDLHPANFMAPRMNEARIRGW